MGKKFFSILFAFFTCCCLQNTFAEPPTELLLSTPPSPLPVKVETSFFLWNLKDISEKNSTFFADIYLMLKWHDSRLAFQGDSKQHVYMEDAAATKLQQIWSPALDFINSTEVVLREKTLTISPNGDVEYLVKVNATFSAIMDLRNFPFDKQVFNIHIESFLWDINALEFVIGDKEIGKIGAESLEDLSIIGFDAFVTNRAFPFMQETFSDFAISIELQRKPGFFLYQVLIPILIVFSIAASMFYLNIEDLGTRLVLAQGCILVFVAMKFIINQDLPQIDYLTTIDYIFFFALLLRGSSYCLQCH